VLLLNVPPNTTGLISENDAHRLKEFRSAINTIFHKNIVEDCYVKVSSQRGGKEGGFGPQNMLDSDHLWSYWAPHEDKKEKEDHWIEIWGKDGILKFNVIRIQEAIGLGQRIKEYEIYLDGKLIIQGTTIGYKRLHRLDGDVVHASVVKIRFIKAKGVPLISSIGLHFDPFWHSKFTAT
jgi:alpha-L-fucosidase